MKIDYRGLYLYIGRNGFIIAFNFDLKGKNYDIAYQLNLCRIDIEEE